MMRIVSRIVPRCRAISRAQCCRLLSSDAFFSRRALSPLVKAIHPDMFVRESVLVQHTNLTCLQSLNEMCDSIEGLENRTSDVVEISKPLKPVYVFDCYMHVHSQHVREGETIKVASTKAVKVTLKTPPSLCTRQRLSPEAVTKALDILLYQLGVFFSHADLESPYINGREKESDGRVEEGVFFMEDKSIVDLKSLQKDVDAQTADAYLQRKDRAIRASVFVQGNSQSARRHHWQLMNEEIESYLTSGNVLTKGLSPPVEKAAVEALRQFFFDYGAMVNFSGKQWRHVVLVLFDKSILPKVPLTPEEVKRRSGLSSGQRKAMDFRGYRCVREGRTYLLEIPHKFKIPALLEFLRVNLPQTSLTAGYSTR